MATARKFIQPMCAASDAHGHDDVAVAAGFVGPWELAD
jgi:hypothetical protein